MERDDLILAEEFCSHYEIEYSFINSLQQFGLIEVASIHEISYIPQSQLQKLEQIIRLHYDLNINLEGLDAILNLLNRIKSMQEEISILKNRLKLHEDF